MNKAEFGCKKKLAESMYLQDKLPMYKIAEKLGIAVGTVYNHLKKVGITSRRTGDCNRGRPMPEHVRIAVSKANKGRKKSEATKQKLSAAKKKNFDGLVKAGHKQRRTDGYISRYAPEHPQATKNGYVMEHIIVMQKAIGKPIKEDEVVHHINHNRSDNRIENLKLMKKHDHMQMHMRLRHYERRLLNEYQ